MTNVLPEVKTKKKIDIKKFVELAKKVKETWKEENKYLEKKYGNSSSSRILIEH